MTLITHKVVPFIKMNGRYVRNNAGKEVSLQSNAKGNSLSKFSRTVGKISHHRWA